MSEAQKTHLLELVHGGDWACATGDKQALRQVCRMMARELDSRHRARVLTIERLARNNMDGATRDWAELGRELRAQPASEIGP
jgi:hypothetical protein